MRRPQYAAPRSCFLWLSTGFVMSHRLVVRVAEHAWRAFGLGGLGLVALLAAGCQAPLTVRGQSNPIAAHPQAQPGVTPWVASVPTEKDKSTLPTYIIEPPDILLIDAVKLVPKSPLSRRTARRAADPGGQSARSISRSAGRIRSIPAGPSTWDRLMAKCRSRAKRSTKPAKPSKPI